MHSIAACTNRTDLLAELVQNHPIIGIGLGIEAMRQSAHEFAVLGRQQYGSNRRSKQRRLGSVMHRDCAVALTRAHHM